MIYDFIEIGTSDFDTLIQRADDTTVGISIEPIKYYLDRLPNPANVKKLNCAVSLDGNSGRDKVFYIPDETIEKHNLPPWIRGCNSVGDYHYQHKRRKLESLVVTEDVDTVPIGDVLEEHKVHQLKMLKVDTEGGDCYILQSLLPVLKDRGQQFWPKHIQFETNILSSRAVIDETVSLYVRLGYKTIQQGNDNTQLLLT